MSYKDFYVYYKLDDGRYRVLCNKTQELKTIEYYELHKIKAYYIHDPKKFKSNDEDLKRYLYDLNMMCYELAKNDGNSIRYTNNYFTHRIAIEKTFHRFAKNDIKKLDYTNEQNYVSYEENKHIENCYNSGLMYFNEKYKDIETQSYGYDFSFNYPSIMASNLLFPKSSGEQKKYKTLDENIEFGYYKVKITSENENIRKILGLNKKNEYHSEEIKFLKEVSKSHNIDIKFELSNEEYNAYVYKNSDLIELREIFGNWYEKLKELKSKFPKNSLVKLLGSRLYGVLSMKNIIIKTEKEIEDEGLEIDLYDADYIIVNYVEYKDRSYYELVKRDETIYKDPILGRMKHIIPMYARLNIANVALENLDNVIRIQTDGIVFITPIDESKYKNLCKEDKTTGKIIWHNVNRYENKSVNKNTEHTKYKMY